MERSFSLAMATGRRNNGATAGKGGVNGERKVWDVSPDSFVGLLACPKSSEEQRRRDAERRARAAQRLAGLGVHTDKRGQAKRYIRRVDKNEISGAGAGRVAKVANQELFSGKVGNWGASASGDRYQREKKCAGLA